MKKAKLMLSAIIIVAGVGGALAFKENRTPITIYTGAKGSGKCQTQTSGVNCNRNVEVAASTTSLASGCADHFICVVED